MEELTPDEDALTPDEEAQLETLATRSGVTRKAFVVRAVRRVLALETRAAGSESEPQDLEPAPATRPSSPGSIGEGRRRVWRVSWLKFMGGSGTKPADTNGEVHEIATDARSTERGGSHG